MRRPAYLQLTRRCNNDCLFCSNPQFDRDMDWQKVISTLSGFREKGITDIIFSGGEPTESSLLPKAIELAVSMGMFPKIITNGVNLSDMSYVMKLKDVGLTRLHVSLHSHIEHDSDSLTGKPGHFSKTVAGIDNCGRAGIGVDLNTTINAVNSKYLSGFMSFVIRRFPSISHIVFNNLDIGCADTRNASKARANRHIIARLKGIERELFLAAMILEAHKRTFRVERVPLCYMPGFEDRSTETRRIVKGESYECLFIEKEGGETLVVLDDPRGERRIKTEACGNCGLEGICAGLHLDYFEMFGGDELYPVFSDPGRIIKKIRVGP